MLHAVNNLPVMDGPFGLPLDDLDAQDCSGLVLAARLIQD
jgi:hypothetical protein